MQEFMAKGIAPIDEVPGVASAADVSAGLETTTHAAPESEPPAEEDIVPMALHGGAAEP